MKLPKPVIILPILALLVAHTIWGINFVVAKVTLQEFPVMSLGFLRFTLALILILPFLFIQHRKPVIKLSDLPKLLIVGLLITVFNIALFYEGIIRTTVTNASVLMMIIPALSVFFGWLILKEKVFVINIVGITLGLLGAVVIIGVPLVLLGISDNQTVFGNLLIIISACCWVAGMILSKELLTKYSSLIITTVSFFVGMVTFLIPAANEYIQNTAWPTQVSTTGILGLLFITVMSSVSAYFLLEWGISKMPISRASMFQYTEPLIATTLGVLVLNERISYSFIVGAIMIGLGVYWGTLGKEAHHRLPKAHRH